MSVAPVAEAKKRERGPLNGVDTPTLFATINVVKTQPDLARFQFRATNQWIKGTHSRSRIETFYGAGGEHRHTGEIEFNADHPAVLEVAVFGIPDTRWGETPCAVVYVKPESIVTEKELIELCATRLGNYKRPGKIVLQHDPLPKTPVGKIKRKELREPFWSGHARRVAGT